MNSYICQVCGYIYDPTVGDILSGVDAGTEFCDILDCFVCPVCSASKDEFNEFSRLLS